MRKCMGCMREYNEREGRCPMCGYSPEQLQLDIQEFQDALKPETILGGRFILGRVLSANDFSMVYISWDALLNRRVAVREYLPFGLGSRSSGHNEMRYASEQERVLFEHGQALFEEESKKLNENQDIPGIVNIYRTIRENGTSYQIMQYLEGVTLQDMMDEELLTSRSQAVRILRSVGEILDALHARGISHYNLSPENILIDGGGAVWLIDFGDTKREVYRMLQRNANILDLRYTAPEVLAGTGAGFKADLYSLGAIYYRIQTGKEPPQSRPLQKKKTGLRIGDPASGRVIESLTMPNPDLRPAEAAGLL